MGEKYIARAAIRLLGQDGREDLVISVDRPGRHHNIIGTLARDARAATPIGSRPKWEQGFTTEEGVFLNRHDAEEYARDHGQIEGKLIGSILTSEDLW